MYGNDQMYLSAKRKPRQWTKSQLEARKRKMLQKMKEFQEKQK